MSADNIKSKTKKYKLVDPFLRTHFKFIEPNRRKIQLNTDANLVDSIMGDSWDTFFGQTFDWFVYSNIYEILELLKIPVGDVIQFGPFFRQRFRNKPNGRGIQIELLLVRKDNPATVIENKFTKEPIGSYIQDEVQTKVENLQFPERFTVEKALICSCGVTRAVSEGDYFSKIITLKELF